MGHNSVAKTLTAQFQQLPGVTAEMLDLLQLIPSTAHPLLQSSYHGMLTRFPFLYNYLYDWTHQSRVIRYVASEIVEKMGWSIRKRLNTVLEEMEPTRIVCTHPFGLVLCPAKWDKLPTVGVVTDYEFHPFWLARVPDALCVPKGLLQKGQLDLMHWRTGVEVVETGLPVRREFCEDTCQLSARQKLGLDPKRPVVLIMGGGTGLGPLEQSVEELSTLTDIQFVVLTGKNETLYRRLQSRYAGSHIRIEPFREDMPLWMSAADLLVTKPGGVTVSEAIAKQLPMFLFPAFAGQEEANQQYLLHHRVAVITRPSTIRIQVEKFFSPGFKREQMRERFTPLMSPQAGMDIIQATLHIETPVLQTLS